MNFLSARWEHLLLANYVVEPEVLQPFVPEGTKLDAFDGQVYVSLVAFLFNRMSIAGIPIPFHQSFEEVNLRFYVAPDKDPSIRAVTFIKEIVPKASIPFISNTLFHENYVTLPMDHCNEDKHHSYSWMNKVKNSISGTIESELTLPANNSISEFITEHYWGYAKAPNYTLEYEVRHPQWNCCEVTQYEINVDYATNYGKEFSFLNDQQPHNVLYAQGSPVSVLYPSRLQKPK
ncbi:YqjF family protein [Rubinisphaera italica]|uniref:DUF2071 domain-containing protein n=1 Tax=Rubinisphaera italica TaxID=2527969 RepID=A0A5C5XJI2_9PLAN|nr:DUF2071 domain-containing protein [Rubinisphaera italica]TWT62888.1 hypothetical protein Pan54_36340 [Rubinisphaera italica]